ncbi:hypothetical protein BH11PLA2_BH11PLA2_40290 [soil metagenome]
MIRYLLTAALGGVLATAAFAQTNGVPTAMPGNSAAASKPLSAPTAMMPTTPTITHQMVAESCRESNDYFEPRLGLFQRLHVLWTGRHCEAPVGSRSDFPGYTNDGYVPQYNYGCTAQSRCTTDRCTRFGTGRFMPHLGDRRSCRGCSTSLLGRMKMFLCWQPGGHEKERCRVPTPYVTPARYYFSGEGEPTYNCANGMCGGAGGCVNSGNGRGLGSGNGIFNGRMRDGEGLGLRQRGCASCRNGEGCSLAGTHFHDTLRYARDEKQHVPAVNVAEQNWYLSGSVNFYYSKKQTETNLAVPAPNTVQQAGYQTPTR